MRLRRLLNPIAGLCYWPIAWLLALIVIVTDTEAKTRPFGIAWLPQVHTTNNPDDPNQWPVWTNPEVWGICARQSWESLETSDGVYDWTYLDAVAANCKAAACWMEITIMVHNNGPAGGGPIPAWLLNEGAQTVTLHDNGGNPVVIPIPWDPVFLSKWQAMISALGARYNPKTLVRLVQMTGPGREGELYFCSNTVTADYTWLQNNGGAAAWTNAAATIASYYHQAFPATRILYSCGSPLPSSVDPNNDTMSNLMNQLDSQYNGTTTVIGWRTSGFYNGAGGLVVNFAGRFKGAQQSSAEGDGSGPTALYAYQCGMWWLEAQAADCNDLNNQADYHTFNTETHP